MSAKAMPPLPFRPDHWPATWSNDEQATIYAFGRLVAQECAGICRDMACGCSAFNSAASAIEAEIRKRFNLETPT